MEEKHELLALDAVLQPYLMCVFAEQVVHLVMSALLV